MRQETGKIARETADNGSVRNSVVIGGRKSDAEAQYPTSAPTTRRAPMSKDTPDHHEIESLPQPRETTSGARAIFLEVNAAYNREGLPMPKPNGPNGRRVLN